MSWSRDQVTLLLEEYRKWPNLYKVKSANYKNRNLRRSALDSITLTLSMKQMKPNITSTEIQNKFQALKQNAMKEYRKYLKSLIKTGTGEDDVYYPSLWYYELIAFTFEESLPRDAFDTLGPNTEQDLDMVEDSQDNAIEHSADMSGIENTEEIITGTFTAEGEFIPDEVADTEKSPDQPRQVLALSLSRSNNNTPSIKRKNKFDNLQMLQSVSGSLKGISAALSKPSQPQLLVEQRRTNEYSAFSDYIAGKMQKIDVIDVEEIQNEVEEQIISILNAGLRKCRETHKTP